MAKARTSSIQHDADKMHYGAISVEMLPDGVPGLGEIQIPVFVQSQSAWYMMHLIGGGGMDISVDTVNQTVEIFFSDTRVYGSYTADAILYGTISGEFYPEAILKGTLSSTFTADAVLV